MPTSVHLWRQLIGSSLTSKQVLTGLLLISEYECATRRWPNPIALFDISSSPTSFPAWAQKRLVRSSSAHPSSIWKDCAEESRPQSTQSRQTSRKTLVNPTRRLLRPGPRWEQSNPSKSHRLPTNAAFRQFHTPHQRIVWGISRTHPYSAIAFSMAWESLSTSSPTCSLSMMKGGARSTWSPYLPSRVPDIG